MKKDWLAYWQNSYDATEVFANELGQKNQAITLFWQDYFASISQNARILDVACGAGSIFMNINKRGNYHCYGADISTIALSTLKDKMPDVTTIECELSKIPLESDSCDVVCSQFGIEYAGLPAFEELARLLKPGGRFVTLSHYPDGYIDKNTKINLSGLDLIIKEQFIEKAMQVAIAFKHDDKNLVEGSVASFMSVEPKVSQYCSMHPTGHHLFIYEGVKQLLSEFNQYPFDQLMNWFNQAKEQALSNHTRLKSMTEACLYPDELQTIEEYLLSQKIYVNPAKPFYMKKGQSPVAWHLSGNKLQ